jgi:hypothetical protein
MPAKQKRPGRARLLLKAHGALAMAAIPRAARKRITTRVNGPAGTLVLTLLPPGEPERPGGGGPPPMSPTCQLICEKIAAYRAQHPAATLGQERLAGLLGWKVGPKLTYLVGDLMEREIVAHNDRLGYDLAGPAAPPS